MSDKGDESRRGHPRHGSPGHAGGGLKADYYDVALRDFGLLLGALSLARLATGFRGGRGVPEHRLTGSPDSTGADDASSEWSERMARVSQRGAMAGQRS